MDNVQDMQRPMAPVAVSMRRKGGGNHFLLIYVKFLRKILFLNLQQNSDSFLCSNLTKFQLVFLLVMDYTMHEFLHSNFDTFLHAYC